MGTAKIAITLDEDLLKRLDQLVQQKRQDMETQSSSLPSAPPRLCARYSLHYRTA